MDPLLDFSVGHFWGDDRRCTLRRLVMQRFWQNDGLRMHERRMPVRLSTRTLLYHTEPASSRLSPVPDPSLW